TFRNEAGVYMKLMNFRRFDPNYGTGLGRGSKVDEQVWRKYAADPERCSAVAAAIRATVASSEALVQAPDEEEIEAEEGRLLTRLHRTRERNRKIVAARKAAMMKKAGVVACEVCAFDFGRVYGKRGHGFIECHHTRPVQSLKPGEKTRLSDLALLCAN